MSAHRHLTAPGSWTCDHLQVLSDAVTLPIGAQEERERYLRWVAEQDCATVSAIAALFERCRTESP